MKYEKTQNFSNFVLTSYPKRCILRELSGKRPLPVWENRQIHIVHALIQLLIYLFLFYIYGHILQRYVWSLTSPEMRMLYLGNHVHSMSLMQPSQACLQRECAVWTFLCWWWKSRRREGKSRQRQRCVPPLAVERMARQTQDRGTGTAQWNRWCCTDAPDVV